MLVFKLVEQGKRYKGHWSFSYVYTRYCVNNSRNINNISWIEGRGYLAQDHMELMSSIYLRAETVNAQPHKNA